MLKCLISLFQRFFCLFPSPLPIGLTAFNKWTASIIRVYNLPDNDSIRFSLATMVLHAPPQACYKRKEFFGRSALKAMSNQVCHSVMEDLKAKRDALVKQLELEAEIEKQNQAAATAPEVVASEPNQT